MNRSELARVKLQPRSQLQRNLQPLGERGCNLKTQCASKAYVGLQGLQALHASAARAAGAFGGGGRARRALRASRARDIPCNH